MANQKSKGRVTTSMSKSTPAPAAQASAPKAAPTAPPAAGSTTAPRSGAQIENKPQAGGITREMVAEAAYFLWLERGGNEAVNWLEAEALLTRQGSGRV